MRWSETARRPRKWQQADLEKGAITVRRSVYARRVVGPKDRQQSPACAVARELLRQLRLHRLRAPGEPVFPGPSGQPIDYHNWRARVWAPLVRAAAVHGTFHMLRHFFVTGLIQSGVNAKKERVGPVRVVAEYANGRRHALRLTIKTVIERVRRPSQKPYGGPLAVPTAPGVTE